MRSVYIVTCIFELFCSFVFFFVFKQKTAYEMRISDWSSDVCSSDLGPPSGTGRCRGRKAGGYRRARSRGRRKHSRDLRPWRPGGYCCRNRASARRQDRKSVVEGKSVAGRVEPGGRRIINKKNN